MSERGSGIMVNFIVRAVLGIGLIFLINQFLSSKGMDAQVGINGISFLTSGIFGIPGVALLYGIVVYQTL